MLPLIQMLVAVEMMLLVPWVAAVMVRPPQGLWRRLARAAAPVVAASVVLAVLAAVAGGPASVEGRPAGGAVADVLRAQAVAGGFLVLLAGMTTMLERLAGPRPAQVLATLAGWALLAAMVLAAPAVELAQGPAKEALARALVHPNPLLVAELELGLKWLHQSLTYRLTPLGESYSYLLGDLAWWKTLLGHVFVGSGLLVFGVRGWRERRA